WLERSVRDRKVAGSNPVAPIRFLGKLIAVNGGGLFPLESSILGPSAAVQSLRGFGWVLFRAQLNRFPSLVLSRFKRLLLALLLNLPATIPWHDSRQDLHYLWKEVAGGRLQWLGKGIRRAGTHLPGVHQCPPARALPIR